MWRDVLFHLRQEGTLTLIFIHGSGMHKEHCEPTIQRLFKHQFPVWQCWFRGQCWFGRGDRGRRGADRERSGVSTVPIRERRSRSQSRSRRRLPRRRSSCSIAWPSTAVADRTVVYQTLVSHRFRNTRAFDLPNHAAIVNEEVLCCGYDVCKSESHSHPVSLLTFIVLDGHMVLWEDRARGAHAFLAGLCTGVGDNFSRCTLVSAGHSVSC